MSLPLLIRQIFSDLIINGPHQNFKFRSESSGVFHLKNEFAITDLIPALMDLKLGDVNHNSFTLRYSGFNDFSKNEFGLYVVKNSVLDPVPVFKINHATKEFTFLGKAYFTKDDGTTALIGSGGGSGGVTQAQLDSVLQQAKDFTQSNKAWFYKFTNMNGEVIWDWSGADNPSTIVPLIKHKIRNNQGMFVNVAFDELGNEVNSYHDMTFGYSLYVKTNGISTWYHFKNDAFDLMGKKILQLADGVNSKDAVNKGQLDSAITALGTIATQDWVNSQGFATGSGGSTNTILDGTTITSSSTFPNIATLNIAGQQLSLVSNSSQQIYINYGFKNVTPYWSDHMSYIAGDGSYDRQIRFGNDIWIYLLNNATTKTIQFNQKVQANGWTPTSQYDLTTKKYVDDIAKGVTPDTATGISSFDYTSLSQTTVKHQFKRKHNQTFQLDIFSPSQVGDDPAMGDGYHNVIEVDTYSGVTFKSYDASGEKKWISFPYSSGNIQFYNTGYDYRSTSTSLIKNYYFSNTGYTAKYWSVTHTYTSDTDYKINYNFNSSTPIFSFGYDNSTLINGTFTAKNVAKFNAYVSIEDISYQIPVQGNHLTTKSYVDLGGIPIGGEITFPKNVTIPSNFLACNGSNFSRTTYPNLGNLYATAGRNTVYVSNDPQITLPNRTAPDAFSQIIVRAK